MLADLGCKSVTSAATVDKALALINEQVYSTGNASRSLRDGFSDRPVLKKPFKYEELAAILARLKLAPIA